MKLNEAGTKVTRRGGGGGMGGGGGWIKKKKKKEKDAVHGRGCGERRVTFRESLVAAP